MPTGIPAPTRTPAGSRNVAASAVALLFAVSLGGCDRINRLIGRGGANLTHAVKVGQEFPLRSLVEAPGAEGSGGTRIELAMQCKVLRDEGDGWVGVEGEIVSGRYEVAGVPREVPLAGMKTSFKYNALRKISDWHGLDFPSGLELLDVAPPKGRLKPRETWNSEAHRMLLVHQEEIVFNREIVLEGEAELAGVPAWKMSVRIPTVKKSLAAGGVQLEFSGSGEIWIDRKEGRLLKATELLEGTLHDEKSGTPDTRFMQGMTLMHAASAPAHMPSLAAPAGAPSTVAAAPAASPPAKTPASVATPPPASRSVTPVAAHAPAGAAERLTFVSRATGRREVWSVLSDGTAKRCLTPLIHEHWNHEPDPEGRHLAVVSSNPGGINVWTINLISGDRMPMTEFAEHEDILTGWSSGGSRLAMVRGGKLWTIHRDGFNLASHTLGGRVVGLATTPASPLVAVVVNELNQNKIFTVDIQRGVIHELFEGEAPAFSPDGLRMAYLSADALFVANSDGSAPTQLVKGQFGDAPIFWHPKGSRIGCSMIVSGDTDVYLLDPVPNTKLTRITKRGGIGVAFSPAGDRVAYLRHGDLWVASVDGAIHTQLGADGTTELPVAWMKHHVP